MTEKDIKLKQKAMKEYYWRLPCLVNMGTLYPKNS